MIDFFKEKDNKESQFLTDQELLKMSQSEDKLYDLHKEHLSNVRTMIVASAAIASANLLALQALQDIGVGKSFLISIAFLYFATIVYVLYLTLTINLQTGNLLQRDAFAGNLVKSLSVDKLEEMEIMKEFQVQSESYFKKVTKISKKLKWSSKLLLLGNILFIVGLCIPIVGFVVLLFS